MRAIFLCCLLCACETPRLEPTPISEAPPSASTRWLPVQSARSLAWLEGPGRVGATPNATALLSTPLSARVLRIRVLPGQQVAAGEPLVDVIMPELIRAAGTLRSADLRLAGLVKRQARLTPLLEQGLTRAVEVAELEATIASTRAERESARATLRSAGESDAHAAALIDGSGSTTLRAPIAGMVVAVTAQLGQVREPGSGPLLELVGTAALQVEARFGMEPPPGVRFEWLAPGQRVPLELDAVSPRAGADGTRVSWLHVKDAAEAPTLGALGRVRMIPPADFAVVPSAALVDGARGPQLRLQTAREGSDLQPVTVLRRSESEAVVVGIAEGTLIAADGAEPAH